MINSINIQSRQQQRRPANAKERAEMIEKKAYENMNKLAEEKSALRKDNSFCGCGLAADGDEQADTEEQNTTNSNPVPDNKPSYVLPVLIGLAAGLSLYLGYLKFKKNNK